MSSFEDVDRIAPEAVADLYRDFGEELRAYLIAVLKDRDQAAEVLQIVLRKALEGGHLVATNIRGWALRVALQEAMLLKRKQSREREVLTHAAWTLGRSESGADDVASGRLQEETVSGVRDAIKNLTSDQQQVVRMRIYEEKTFAVIAAELNQPLGTVLTRMRVAMQKLEAALQSHRD